MTTRAVVEAHARAESVADDFDVGELDPSRLERLTFRRFQLRNGSARTFAGAQHPSFRYELLWRERVLRSVANLTWADGREFLAVAAGVPVRTRVTTFTLDQANEALAALRGGGANGAIVLLVAA